MAPGIGGGTTQKNAPLSARQEVIIHQINDNLSKILRVSTGVENLTVEAEAGQGDLTKIEGKFLIVDPASGSRFYLAEVTFVHDGVGKYSYKVNLDISYTGLGVLRSYLPFTGSFMKMNSLKTAFNPLKEDNAHSMPRQKVNVIIDGRYEAGF